MRKSLAVIAATFYLLISSWVSFNLHFCHGQLAGITLYGNDTCEGECHQGTSCCAPEEPCCEFDKIQLGIEDEHRTPGQSFSELVIVDSQPVVIPEVTNTLEGELTVHAARDGPPPIDIRIHFCSLTFYS